MCYDLDTVHEDSAGMSLGKPPRIIFARLPEISSDALIAHMSDPRVATHMPLLTFTWDHEAAARFVETKEECWRRDGVRVTREALGFARADARIPFVTFLLPPSRRNVAALDRLGARFVGEIEHDGARFLKFTLDTK